MTGALSRRPLNRPSRSKFWDWIAERIDGLFSSSRIVEHHDLLRQLRGTVWFSNRSSHEPLERIEATWWSMHSITVSGKKLRLGGETDLFLDGFPAECLLVAASA